MPKEKIVEQIVEESNNNSNIIMQYLPILIGLICLIICYLLYKKIQTINSQSDSITNLEKHFTHYIKEQTEINSVTAKKLTAINNHMNQLNHVLQNQNVREVNNINTQMSPNKNKNIQKENIEQPVNRQLMPTVIISNTDNEIKELPKPISTTNKKSVNIENIENIENISKSKNKKVNLQTLREEVLIEEASTDDEN